MSKLNKSRSAMLVLTTCLTALAGTNTAFAAGVGGGVYAFPQKGQSEEQVGKDKYYCHNWAVTETGFDPMRPPPAPQSYGYSSPPPSSSGYFGKGETGEGGVVRDAAGGAALGAIGGAIAGDAGKGAAIGALAGGLFGGVKRSNRHQEERRWQEQQYQQQAQQQQAYQQQIQQQNNSYARAYGVCMESRGYAVQ